VPYAPEEQEQQQDRVDAAGLISAFGSVAVGDGEPLAAAAAMQPLLRTADALRQAGDVRLQQLTHQLRTSADAAAVAEQAARLASLQALWERISVPARIELSAVAEQKQAEYEAMLELNEALGTLLLEANQQLFAGGLDGGTAVEGFLMVAHEILDQAPPLQAPE
jgi:hypothetical protein